MLFPEEGPVEGFEFCYQFFFAASEIAVAHLMESRTVVKFRQMCKFVTYYIITQFGCEEKIHV